MKNIILTLSLSAPVFALAQGAVTLHGIVDEGFTRLAHLTSHRLWREHPVRSWDD
ncbi:hypothetical protein GCM10011400_61010 [Paraburkholderia caffeinilytica]|uniref:Uncharacterized protein n=1 Tax=Paraburkholderia caffeinilytica TaxID=1761016 RepID=A0ABQ1NDU8_9BURK|nr:hypothetical protein GCM10011400_61010 [Paraburkholderia caffeinilytica]